MANVSDFGARGDGKADDTAALQHALQDGDGHLLIPRGEYRLTRPLAIALDRLGRTSISGQGGGAKLVMAGAGPALHFIGTHRKTAKPQDFAAGIWQNERMPMVSDLEIEGAHREADGIRLEGVMQPTLRGLLIRRCRHGVHLTQRDRNVVIADCHISDNSGAGVFFDHVNLHHTNIHGNHISYCKQGGVRIVGSEIRNLQICSNDIEYNFDPQADTSADVLFDCREGTVREATIVGNTIQALLSPGGANVRLIGVGKDNPNATGLLAIAGNLIGSQETLLHLQACRGVVVSGNSLYSGFRHALLAEDAEDLVIGANSIDHNPEYPGKSTDAVVLRGCRNVNITGLLLQHTREALVEPPASMEIRDCHNVNLTGCQIINARTRGILVAGSSVIRVADCTLRGRRDDRTYRTALDVDRASAQVMAVNNFLGKGSEGELQFPKAAGMATGNIALA